MPKSSRQSISGVKILELEENVEEYNEAEIQKSKSLKKVKTEQNSSQLYNQPTKTNKSHVQNQSKANQHVKQSKFKSNQLINNTLNTEQIVSQTNQLSFQQDTQNQTVNNKNIYININKNTKINSFRKEKPTTRHQEIKVVQNSKIQKFMGNKTLQFNQNPQICNDKILVYDNSIDTKIKDSEIQLSQDQQQLSSNEIGVLQPKKLDFIQPKISKHDLKMLTIANQAYLSPIKGSEGQEKLEYHQNFESNTLAVGSRVMPSYLRQLRKPHTVFQHASLIDQQDDLTQINDELRRYERTHFRVSSVGGNQDNNYGQVKSHIQRQERDQFLQLSGNTHSIELIRQAQNKSEMMIRDDKYKLVPLQSSTLNITGNQDLLPTTQSNKPIDKYSKRASLPSNDIQSREYQIHLDMLNGEQSGSTNLIEQSNLRNRSQKTQIKQQINTKQNKQGGIISQTFISNNQPIYYQHKKFQTLKLEQINIPMNKPRLQQLSPIERIGKDLGNKTQLIQVKHLGSERKIQKLLSLDQSQDPVDDQIVDQNLESQIQSGKQNNKIYQTAAISTTSGLPQSVISKFKSLDQKLKTFGHGANTRLTPNPQRPLLQGSKAIFQKLS